MQLNRAREFLLKNQNLIREIIFNNQSPSLFFNNRSIKERNEFIATLIGEALEAISLLERHNLLFGRTLEIGGGCGLTHAALRNQGIEIVSIEPGGAGFSGYFELGKEVVGRLINDTSGWISCTAEGLVNWNRKFDLIFSLNVLEHIPNQFEALKGMVSVLEETGTMVHQTVNYLVPYEPHFCIPLVPIYPRLTELFYPSLKSNPFWRDLYFTTPVNLSKNLRKLELETSFDRFIFRRTLDRLTGDMPFILRHPFLSKVANVPLLSNLLYFVSNRLPANFQTPLLFVAKRFGQDWGKPDVAGTPGDF